LIHAHLVRIGAVLLLALSSAGPARSADPDHGAAPSDTAPAAQAAAQAADHAASPTSEHPAAPTTEQAAAPESQHAATPEHAAGAAHPEGEAHASPNLFSVEPGLMIWTIVTFLVVLLILRATAWKPIMAALEEREKKIEGAIAEAARIKNDAEQLHAKYQTLVDRAKDEGRAILDEARKDGIALQEELRNRAKQEAEEFKARAHREIELQKDAAIKEIWDQTAGLATTLASRVLGRTLEGADQERLVKELLAGMQADAAAPAGRAPERRT
jgi:F-type H+-transporting ATPase subunit b